MCSSDPLNAHSGKATPKPDGSNFESLALSPVSPSTVITPETLAEHFYRYRSGNKSPNAGGFQFEGDLFICQGIPPRKESFDRVWLIDADDTLWEDNLHFEELINELILHARSQGVVCEAKDLRECIDAVEHEIIPQLGFGADGFSVSLRESWRRIKSFYAPQAKDPDSLFERVFPYLRSVPFTSADDARHFLSGLRKVEDHALVLFTQGPLETQIQKIINANLAPFFDGVVVGRNKKTETYSTLVENLHFRGKNYAVVGNSLNSEIKPALELGYKAFHLLNPNSWHPVNSTELPMESYKRVNSLSEILEISW